MQLSRADLPKMPAPGSAAAGIFGIGALYVLVTRKVRAIFGVKRAK